MRSHCQLAARTSECPQPFQGTLQTKRRRSGAPGQELLELALLIPLLMVIAVGVLDLGRAFHASITIENAAREGARFGTFDPGDLTGIVATTQAEAANSGINISSGMIAVTCPDGPCASGLPVRVTVSYPFQMVMGTFFPAASLTLGGTAEMMVP